MGGRGEAMGGAATDGKRGGRHPYTIERCSCGDRSPSGESRSKRLCQRHGKQHTQGTEGQGAAGEGGCDDNPIGREHEGRMSLGDYSLKNSLSNILDW
ncbi:hypothetical protein AMTR_s00023p00131030 [Amborella trichopoda]|uniref:Uncharacterized protein n=1 Tax=Amborella trichopoda TaxID=13333 RepID=W1NK83_AMBTC|nr:hypothetical protein AMTR_s00023p00131030 [Amborella trichopoda]